jgi:hypothetical protein
MSRKGLLGEVIAKRREETYSLCSIFGGWMGLSEVNR